MRSAGLTQVCCGFSPTWGQFASVPVVLAACMVPRWGLMSVALVAREIRKISAIVAFSRVKRDIERTHFQKSAKSRRHATRISVCCGVQEEIGNHAQRCFSHNGRLFSAFSHTVARVEREKGGPWREKPLDSSISGYPRSYTSGAYPSRNTRQRASLMTEMLGAIKRKGCVLLLPVTGRGGTTPFEQRCLSHEVADYGKHFPGQQPALCVGDAIIGALRVGELKSTSLLSSSHLHRPCGLTCVRNGLKKGSGDSFLTRSRPARTCSQEHRQRGAATRLSAPGGVCDELFTRAYTRGSSDNAQPAW